MISIKDIADVLGTDAAEDLMKVFPGERLYIPKKQVNKQQFETSKEYYSYIFQLCSGNNMNFETVSEITGLSVDRIRHIAADEIRNRRK